METEKRYFAFISYKEEDYKMAKWLQHKLEHYHLPSVIRKDNPELPKRISPIFEYKSEMSGGYLKPSINAALDESKYLIVICSPNAPKSIWVADEVQKFINARKTDYIIPFIIAGEAYSKNPQEECFPEPLRNLKEPLRGININELGRNAAAIKVVAQMFGLKFDTLWRRYERHLRKKIYIVIALLLLFTIFAFLFAGWIHEKNVALRHSNRNILENQGRFVANKMESLIDEGDIYAAMLVGVELLKDDNRPYVPQVEIALRRACDSLESIGLHPVTIFKLEIGPYGGGHPIKVGISSDSKKIMIQFDWYLDFADESPIRIYSASTGELLESITEDEEMDKIRIDGYNITSVEYDDNYTLHKDYDKEIWAPDHSFMIKAFEDKCIMYKCPARQADSPEAARFDPSCARGSGPRR